MGVALDATLVAETAERIRVRIAERFPGSGILGVAEEVVATARASAGEEHRIRRRNVALAALAWVLASALVILPVATFATMRFDLHVDRLTELLQAADAALQSAVLLGAGIFFVLGLESRLKRNLALRLIYRIRSLAHVIDMHQLAKDPDRFLGLGPSTPSSPKVELTPFEMSRYFDYCSELLSILAKVAAVYGQGLRDEVALDAVDQIETLTAGLCQKIWQKTTILDRILAEKR